MNCMERTRTMSDEQRLNRLNGATRELLERCYQSGSWLASLAEYSQRLKRDGWNKADIEEVQATVWRILRAVAESDAVPAAEQSSSASTADLASA